MDVPVDDVLLVPGTLCTAGLAHIVSEQVMATHAKSKMAANLYLLRFGFIDFSLGFGFLVSTSVRCLLFGSRTNVFLLCKAETAVKTRQVFLSRCSRPGSNSFSAFEARPQLRVHGRRRSPGPGRD